MNMIIIIIAIASKKNVAGNVDEKLHETHLFPRVNICHIHQSVMFWQNDSLNFVAYFNIKLFSVDIEFIQYEFFHMSNFEDSRTVEEFWFKQSIYFSFEQIDVHVSKIANTT